MVKSHYNQQARLKQLARFDGKHYKLTLVDLERKMIGTRNVESAFYLKGLYPDELEKELKWNIEDPGMRIFDKVYKSKGAVVLTREEMEMMRKYLLVQLYRNPANMATYSPSWDGDILGMNKRFENDAEANLYVAEQIHEICSSSWDELCNSSNLEIRKNVLTINDTKTLFVKSPLLKFVINDLGCVCESQPWGRYDRDFIKKELEEICGKVVSDEIVNEWIETHSYYNNFTFYPLSFNFGVVTISPQWSYRISKMQPYKIVKPLDENNDLDFQINMSFFKWMDENTGLHSQFIMENYVPCINFYESEVLQNAKHEDIPALLEEHRSPNDLYFCPVAELTLNWATYLNGLTINESQSFFAFGDNNDGNYSICDYIDYAITHKNAKLDLKWILDTDINDWNIHLN